MTDQLGYQGTQEPSDDKGAFNAISFLVSQMLARLNIATVVKVMAVDDPGGTAAAGTVDVQPMVNQLSGALTIIPHGTVFGLPYMRLQGGQNAFVVVPQVGDLGIALFADRDISSVKAAQDQANPGSLRRFDMADGMYLGGMLNGAPTRFVRIDDSGVTITGIDAVTVNGNAVAVNAANSATITSPDIQLDGNATVNGSLTVNGAVTATGDVTGNGTSLHSHRHGGVKAGFELTSTPV